MIDGWITDEIDNLCNVEYGTRVVQKNDGGTIYPVYGGGGATFAMDIFNREDRLTIARFAMSAKCTRFVKGKFFLNDSGLTLSPKDKSKIEQEFLNYQCLAMNDVFYSLAKGSAQKNLDVPAFRKLKLNIPKDIKTQRKIVFKLDAIFAEIDKAIAAAEVNAKNAEALFQSYLLQVFDDFGKNYISDTISNVCILRSGTTVNSSLEKTEGEIPYLKVADMNLIFNQESITTSSRFLNKSDINKKSVIPKGSTIFPKRGGAIDTNKKRITDVDIAVDLNIMSVYPSEKINPYLLYFYFLSLDMKKLGSGSSIRQINNYDIEPLVINFPKSMDEQLELINCISNLKIHSEKLSLNYKNKKSELLSLKQSILKQAFNGELVKE